MLSNQKGKNEKVQRFISQWKVTEDVAKLYLVSEEWVYVEACLSYSLDMDYRNKQNESA